MYCGLDVGGTHTDAVLVDEGGAVVAAGKVLTDHNDLIDTVHRSLDGVLDGRQSAGIRWINLSTTLSTNAIVEGKNEEVGVMVSAGPGINPFSYSIGENYHFIRGAIDHRGFEIQMLDEREAGVIAKKYAKKGLRVYATVSKFSTRNPAHELRIGEMLNGQADFVSLGHRLSGELNFPRRINTAYYNSSVWRLFNRFAVAVEETLQTRKISAQVNILKADGGTMPLPLARNMPVESILSGPAASVMGVLALCDVAEDAVVLDIGGTTTDIAIFAGGDPIVEREGITLNSHRTLVRSLRTRSIGVGGDSVIRCDGGEVSAGPDRAGPSMADGGVSPTVVDAFNFLGVIDYANAESSRRGIVELAAKSGMEPASLANAVIEKAVATIRAAVDDMLDEINSRPVYTIHELLEERPIRPARIYVMGGPAHAFREALGKAFALEVVIPRMHGVANAIGATLAKTTVFAELFADTERGTLLIPNLGVNTGVTGSYALEQAREDARKYLRLHLESIGRGGEADVEVTESSSFNMVQGFTTTGRNMRVKCQVKPGVMLKVSTKGLA